MEPCKPPRAFTMNGLETAETARLLSTEAVTATRCAGRLVEALVAHGGPAEWVELALEVAARQASLAERLNELDHALREANPP